MDPLQDYRPVQMVARLGDDEVNVVTLGLD